MVSDCCSITYDNSAAPTAGQTLRWNGLINGNPGHAAGTQDAAAGGSVTLSWTGHTSTGTNPWATVAAEILAAASSTPGNPYYYRYLAGGQSMLRRVGERVRSIFLPSPAFAAAVAQERRAA